MYYPLLAARQVLQVTVQNGTWTANGSLWIGCERGEGVGLCVAKGDGAVGKVNIPKSAMGKLAVD